MEKEGVIMSQLSEGIEIAKELKKKMDHPSSTNSREECAFLLDRIVSCYDSALLALLENGDPIMQFPDNVMTNINLEGSTTSEASHLDSKEHVCKHAVSKKRKSSGSTRGRSDEQVNVCSGVGFGGQVDDGYYWRKYGQKDILGANHPRAYYRCTHRYTQGCLATKQVQQMDNSPTNSQVVYKGTHTCTQQLLKHNNQNLNDNHILQMKQEQGEERSFEVENQEQLMMITQKENADRVEPENVETDRFFVDPRNAVGTTTYSVPPTDDFITSHSLLLSPDMNFPTGGIDLLIDDHEVDFDYHFLGAADYF